jgi:hypothetical protein
VKNKEKLIPQLTKAKMTAKADEVKAIGKTLKESRVAKEKQLKVASTGSLPPHFATTRNISSLSYTHIIFSFAFLLSILLFRCSVHLYQIHWITIFKHLPLETSAIAKCFVYHNEQLQFRRRPQ